MLLLAMGTNVVMHASMSVHMAGVINASTTVVMDFSKCSSWLARFKMTSLVETLTSDFATCDFCVRPKCATATCWPSQAPSTHFPRSSVFCLPNLWHFRFLVGFRFPNWIQRAKSKMKAQITKFKGFRFVLFCPFFRPFFFRPFFQKMRHVSCEIAVFGKKKTF